MEAVPEHVHQAVASQSILYAPKAVLTLGCRRYFLLVLVPMILVEVGSPCLLLLSGPESSPLRYDRSTLVALAGREGSGRSDACPRDSAMALCSFWWME